MNLAIKSSPLAPVALQFKTWVAGVGTAVWHALEASGEVRAQRHLLDFAEHCEDLQPELAKELRAAARYTVSH
jgi:hypothetical protein